jgi:hypothetical protein
VNENQKKPKGNEGKRKREHSRFLRWIEKQKKKEINSSCIYFIFLFFFSLRSFTEIEQEKGDVNEISSCLFSVLGEIKGTMSDDYPTIQLLLVYGKERNSRERERKKKLK